MIPETWYESASSSQGRIEQPDLQEMCWEREAICSFFEEKIIATDQLDSILGVGVFFWVFFAINNQFSSVAQSCPTLCDSMDCPTPRFPVHHQLLELARTQCSLNWWCHPNISSSVVLFSSCLQSFPASGFFQCISSSHQMAKVLAFQLQHQSFQWIFRTNFLEDWLVWSLNF